MSFSASAQFAVMRTDDGPVVVIVIGDIAYSNRDRLKQLVTDVLVADLEQQRVGRYAIDLEKCTSIDSAGIGALISLSRKIREAGGSLELRGVSEDHANMFRAMKLEDAGCLTITPAVSHG